MFLRSFFHRPQSGMLRKALFQVHLWMGVCVGLYIFVIGITGSALMFRPEMQKAAYPQFFEVKRTDQPDADAAEIIRRFEAGYPGDRLVGIDWPTYRRETVLAYMSRGNEFLTVFAHPQTAAILGELPEQSWLRWLQELHFHLLAGATGLVINGLGGLCLLVMCITGLIIWWPGADRWRQSLSVDFRKGWKRIMWELHGAAGFWALAFLMMWAVTGVYFAFPQTFRSVVSVISPISVARPPESHLPLKGRYPAPEVGPLLAESRGLVPGATLARLVLPSNERATILVVMAQDVHGDFDTSDEISLYFDQYDGKLVLKRQQGRRTMGDVVMAWVGPLHVGSFGGMPIKVLWAVVGLSFALLFVTGVLMWWNRVLSDKWATLKRGPASIRIEAAAVSRRRR